MFDVLRVCYRFEWFFTVAFLLPCREGSARGFGIRKSNSSLGSDSWVDDPITRHIIGLNTSKEHEEDGDKNLLWPLILHIRGNYSILVLPLVEPRHVKAYARLCKRPTCGSSLGLDDGFSSLLLDLPSITGYAKLLYLHMTLTFKNCTITKDNLFHIVLDWLIVFIITILLYF